MIIEDSTINKKFSELATGTCFVMYSEYYMKLHIKYYDEYSNNESSYLNYAVNLRTGFASVIKDEEKVRVISGKMIITENCN